MSAVALAVPQARRRPPVQTELRLDWRLPSGVSAQPPAPAAEAIAHRAILGSKSPASATGSSPSATQRPPAQAWAGRLALAAIDIDLGKRPLAQLNRWVTPKVLAELARSRRNQVRPPASPALRTTSQNARVLRVHASSPADDVVEASVVIQIGDRARAVAIRLVGQNDRWIATVLQVI